MNLDLQTWAPAFSITMGFNLDEQEIAIGKCVNIESPRPYHRLAGGESPRVAYRLAVTLSFRLFFIADSHHGILGRVDPNCKVLQ